jgi:hypothetical protein
MGTRTAARCSFPFLATALAIALLLAPPSAAQSDVIAPRVTSGVLPPPGAWAQQPVAPGPAPTSVTGTFGWDAVMGRYLLFGGAAANDLWTFDPATDAWQLITPSGTPPGVLLGNRYAAWDPVGRRFIVVVVTPYNGGQNYTDVATYDVATNSWSTYRATGGPIDVFSAAVVWDTLAHRLLLFGGCYGVEGCRTSGDIWSYDPATHSWAYLPPNGPAPAPRYSPSAAFDTNDNRLLVFGGGYSTGFVSGDYNDVWSWDSLSHTWTELTVTNAGGGPLPATRQSASAVWDPVHRQLLVFGGLDFTWGVGFTVLDDLWALRPASHAWAQLTHTAPRPPATERGAAVWDPTTASMRLLTADPSVPPLAAALWTYRPAAPQPGGASFTLQTATATGGTRLSWQTGDSQSGYRVMRRTATTTTVVGSTLAASATTITDPAPPPGACYQLATMGGYTILAASPLLCTFTTAPTQAGDPRNLSISVDPSNRWTLRWDAPAVPGPGFTGYAIVRLDNSAIIYPGLQTEFTSDPWPDPSCWYVLARYGPTGSGRSPTVCAVPSAAFPP